MKKLALYFLFALPALAQVVPFRSPRATFTTSTGQPLSGGCIYTYQGGTTTPQATYTSSTGGTPNSNPVILDASGSAVMWFGVNTYKLVAFSRGGTGCVSGSLQWSVDQIPGNAFLNGTISGATITTPAISGGTQSGTALSGVTVAGSNIQSTVIGTTTPAAAIFTSEAAGYDVVPFSGTPVFNATIYNSFTLNLTGNVSSSTINGGSAGQILNFQICQGGSGGYSFAWPASMIFPLGIPSQVSAKTGSCTTLVALGVGGNWVPLSTNLTFTSNANTPTLSAFSSLGTGGTALLQTGSNDFAGAVVLSSGTGPVNPWSFTFTFGQAYSTNTFCEFTPQNSFTNATIPASILGFQGGTSGGPSMTITGPAALPGSTPSALILTYLCHN